MFFFHNFIFLGFIAGWFLQKVLKVFSIKKDILGIITKTAS